MRPAARLALAALSALALAVPLAGTAAADPQRPGLPSEEQVAKAKKDVAEKQQSVAQMQSALVAAQGRLGEAITRAEVAAEHYNGALWHLTQAREQSKQAKAVAEQAKRDVASQRSGIITLVTESYQNGTELTTATALMSDEGPDGLMNRYSVVQSAGDSMQARYDRFRAASAIAKVSAAKAVKAQDRQRAMAKEARTLAEDAGTAAAAAGAAANEIAVQKQAVAQALAKAENISVDLATKRQDGLEKIAAAKAAALAKAKAQAKEAAEQAKLKKAAAEAKQQAKAAKVHAPDTRGTDGSDRNDTVVVPLPVIAPPVVVNPAPNAEVGVQRAIAYAKAQLGKPYQWAASGPFTFDCSGLTMRAWAAGGKSLPHYSVAQFYESQRIAMTDLQPGDLLFWSNNGSPSGIHHVALYIGAGQFIEAPHTGAVVRYNSIANWYPDYAARP